MMNKSFLPRLKVPLFSFKSPKHLLLQLFNVGKQKVERPSRSEKLAQTVALVVFFSPIWTKWGLKFKVIVHMNRISEGRCCSALGKRSWIACCFGPAVAEPLQKEETIIYLLLWVEMSFTKALVRRIQTHI